MLTEKEQAVLKRFSGHLRVRSRRTKNPNILAMVGLVGSGKTRVAMEFAYHLCATVISGDDVRVELRHEDEKLDNAWVICCRLAEAVLEQGGNVILDSDHVESQRRDALKVLAKKHHAQLHFIRTVCERDVMFGRIMSDYLYSARPLTNDFFAGATCAYRGNKCIQAATVKIRELWRRTLLHYEWLAKGSGTWRLKEMDIGFLGSIETSIEVSWKEHVRRCAQSLL